MHTLDTYRTLAPDHPVWQQRQPAGPGSGEPPSRDRGGVDLADEDGSLITEYGLLAIVAATVAAAVISWASDGAMATLFNSLLQQARGIVGA
jgi:Flp pilus assembly pilin Flp